MTETIYMKNIKTILMREKIGVVASSSKWCLNSLFILLTLFLSSCNFNETYVRILASNTSTQAMKVVQTEEISGGFSSEKAEVGIYTCEYGNVLYASNSCDNLDRFNFENTKGRFNWTPSYQQVGHYRVVIQSPKGNKNVTIIAVEKKNEAPVVSLSNVNSTALENSSYSLNFDATDLNEDELTYSYECLSHNCEFLKDISLNESTKTFSFSTDYNSEGNYSFLLKVSDGDLEDSITFDVGVLNVNRAPILTVIGNKNVDENVQLAFDLEAVDQDGDNLTFSCGTTCPVGMSISGRSVSWTPTLSQGGSYSVTFTVTDGSLVDSETIEVVVRDVNRAPELDVIGDQVVKELEAIVAINAGDSGSDFDVDGDALTYSCYYDLLLDGNVESTSLCSSLKGGAFNSTTGAFTWTTAAGSPGIYEFKIIASDGQLEASRLFSITVTSAYPLILTYKTTTANEMVWLPVNSSFSGSYDYKVDWGDDSAVQIKTAGHTYVSAGTYKIRVYGVFPYISYNLMSSTDKNKLIGVDSLGRTGLLSLNYAFDGCTRLSNFTVGDTDTSNVTGMTGMFSGATSLVNLDLRGMDTSKVTSMYGMFSSATNLMSINLSSFNTSNVTSMANMFYYVPKLTSLDLSNFDTAKVTSMSRMFASNALLSSLNISSFDTANVTTMSGMFSGLKALVALDLSNFNTTKVTDMNGMFNGSNNLEILNVSIFRTPNVTDMSWMFNGLGKVVELDVSHFDTAKVTDMNNMFNSTQMLASLDLSSFNTSNVTNMYGMFYGLAALTTLDLSSFNTIKVTDMSSMFGGASGFTSLDISHFNTAAVTNMSRMFYQNTTLVNLLLPSANAENVTNMSYMFSGASSIQSLDFSNFETLKVTDMSYMFENMSALTGLNFTNINTPNLTNMRSMFSGASALINLNLSDFETANVTTMENLFYGTSALTTLNIANFNTANVQDMTSMFRETGLTELNLSHFDVGKVVYMSYIFRDASKLASLDLRGWTRGVNSTYTFMGMPSGRIIYCNQDPTGNAFGIGCTP